MIVHCHDEPVATNTIYFDTPFIDDGSTREKLFVDTESLFSDVYETKTNNQFVKSFKNNIPSWGEMSTPIIGFYHSEVNKHAHMIFGGILIYAWQCEPHYQHRKFSECCYQTIKNIINIIIDCISTSDYTWLLIVMYV